MAERISKEKIKDEVTKITSLTEQIKTITESMPDCTAKKAYMNSVLNLEKKNEQFGKEREKLSDEEKEVMKKALNEFRSQKKNDEVSTITTTETNESIIEVSKGKMGKGKRNN